jgi:hypothetical protein
LNTALDPRLDQPPVFDGSYAVEVTIQAIPPEPPKFMVEFDPRLPAAPQLAAAEQLLLHRSKKLPMPQLQVAKFSSYLRLLDFKEIGAEYNEIGQILFPYASGERLRTLIRDSLIAARNRQNDYLLIALKSSSDS